jgi:hypothetical protein
MKSSKTVRFQLDPSNPPVLTPEERKAWEQAKATPDEEIDLSDMPERTTSWRRISDLIPAEKMLLLEKPRE